MTTLKKTFREESVINQESNFGKKHVALVYGGMSAEREVSLMSYKGLAQAIINNGYKLTSIDMGADISRVLSEVKPDIVYNGLYGTYGEDGCLPGILNILNIPYTHSGVLASSICFDKKATRSVCSSNNIRCANGILVKKSENISSDPMQRPYVIKPLREGSSIGVIVVFEEDDFDFKDYCFDYGDEILVEKYIKGREIQVAALNGEIIGMLEIELLKNRFYDYETKYTDGMANHVYPARINEKTRREISVISKNICEIFGVRGVARLEFIYSDEKDKFYFLEVNTHPGFTPLSIVPEIAMHNGMSFESLIGEILSKARCD